MTNRENKKEKFASNKKNSNTMVIVAAAVLVAIGIVGFIFANKSDPYSSKNLKNVGSVSYQGQTIQMTEVTNIVENGKVKIALADITSAKIIYTEYTNGTKTLPLTAFVTPTGNIVAAVSICEPCRGYKFHIQGNDLVCNQCATRWTLDGLVGISGGCMQYPPDKLNYEIDGSGKYLIIDEQEVINWQPRP